MGNAAGGTIFGADRLRDFQLPPPAPIPPPTSIMPPQSGLISDMVRGDTGMTTRGGYPSHGEGTRPPGGGLGGDTMFPIPGPVKGTGEVPTPVKGVEPRGGVVSEIAQNPTLPFEAPTWQAPGKTIPTMPVRGTGLIGGMVGGNMPNPTPTPAPTPAPVAPTPVAPTPITPAKPTVAAPKTKKKKAAVETDPYERWKQLGRPGGSFEGWQGSQ